MRFLESSFYSILVVISNIFILNILWLVSCLPIITIFPATAAMFGVVRRWIVDKDYKVARPYFTFFKANFKQSFIIGLVWSLIALFLAVDFNLVLRHEFGGNFMLPLLILISFFFVLVSAFLFPTIVHFKATKRQILKNSLLLSVSYLPISLPIIIIAAFCAITIYILPVIGLFIVGLAAYIIYLLSHIAFTKAAKLNGQKNSLNA